MFLFIYFFFPFTISQSSGSGSESGTQTRKSAKSISNDESDNNTGSSDEHDNESNGPSIRDGSDNGSGTQVIIYLSFYDKTYVICGITTNDTLQDHTPTGPKSPSN